ncbi:MAG: hypothetical protein QXZ49_01465 [Nitrososphaerota archaeon]
MALVNLIFDPVAGVLFTDLTMIFPSYRLIALHTSSSLLSVVREANEGPVPDTLQANAPALRASMIISVGRERADACISPLIVMALK